MRALTLPNPEFTYDADTEINRLIDYRKKIHRNPSRNRNIPTNVSDTADYDQIAVTPGVLSRITKSGVFDFDGAIFADIYDNNSPGYWRTCSKYYNSDHRPLWVQFEL